MLSDIQSDISGLKRRPLRDLGRSRDAGNEEGIIRLTAAIMEHIAKNPEADVTNLMDNPDFRNELIKKIDAPTYFPRLEDFITNVERIAASLSQKKNHPARR
jgi:hypothetical protein